MGRVSAPSLITTKTKKPATTPAPAPPTQRRRSRKATTKTGAAGADPEQETSSAGAETEQQPAGKRVAAARPATPPLPDGIPGEKRITLPLWHSLWRALRLANVDDGIDTTVRIRSMIELWEHDPRLRARVDRLARDRAASLARGRPRTRE